MSSTTNTPDVAVRDATEPGRVRGAIGVTARVVGAVVLGFGFVLAVVSLGAAVLAALTPMARSDAIVLMSTLGFLLYVVAVMWAFAVRRVWLVWAVLGGGGACAYALAVAVSRLLPGA